MTTAALSWRHVLRSLRRRRPTAAGAATRGLFRIPRLERLEPRQAPAANDTLATAIPLLFDGNQQALASGTIADPNQVDLYEIPLNAGDEVTAEIQAYSLSNPLESVLRIFNDDGQQMAFNNNQEGPDPDLTFTTPAAGAYFVGVSSASNFTYDPLTSGSGSGGNSTGTYTLNIARSPSAETGLNGSFQTADVINGNADVQGTLAVGAQDYFRFTVAQTGLLTATVTPAGGSGLQPRLALYGDSQQLLIQSDAASVGNASVPLSQHLQPGTYFLAISALTDNPAANQHYVLDTTFAPALPPFQAMPAGASYAVAVGNFTHDGNLDLVTANASTLNGNLSGNTVSVLLGRGDGTFLPAAAYTVGNLPVSVAVGDFTHDGNLDLVSANYLDNTVSVLLGNGDGTFSPDPFSSPGLPPGTFSVMDASGNGQGPISVAVGMFTHDGNLDLVTANNTDNTVSVLEGNGDGNFQPAATYSVGNGPNSVAVGDFNDDGNLDIVTANTGENNSGGTVSVLVGRGDGTFILPAATYTVGPNPNSVAVGDFNHDGNFDIVTANSGYPSAIGNFNGDTVSVLLGRGDGTFLPEVTYTVGIGPYSVAVGDFTNDGTLDLVTANSADGTVSVLLGRGDGTFLPALTSSGAVNAISVAVGDFTHDGNLDVVTNDFVGNTVSVLLGRGDGTFQSAATNTVGTYPTSVAMGNFNHDGNLDLVTASNADSTVSVLLGRGDGTFLPAATYPVGNEPIAVAEGDFNDDGNLDIVTANTNLDQNTGIYGPGSVSVLLGRGDGTFLPAVTYSVGTEPTSVAVGDFNGNLDIVTANRDYDQATGTFNGDTVSVLLGRGDGTFLPAATYTVGNGPTSVAVGDFTHDGNLDIITANAGDNTVSVLLGNGDGTFTPDPFHSPGLPPGTFSVGNAPTSVAVGDFNGNLGIVTANSTFDLATGLFNGDTVSVLLGRGDGNFLPAAIYTVGNGPDAVAVGDFNNDGNLDLVTANDQDNTVSVLLGRGNGTFLPAATYSVGTAPLAVAVGDFNQDGNLDLVTANQVNNTVSVLLGNGDGTFQTGGPESGITIRNIPFLQDLNGDNIADSLILNSSGDVLFRRGLPGASNEFAPPVVINPGRPARDVTIFRTAAGWAVAAVDDAGNTVSIYTWDPATQSFQRTIGFATGNLPVRIAAADVNGDGLDDLVVANDFDNSVTIAFQNPDGTFSTVTRPVGVGLSDIAITNLGGQHGPDIVVSDQVSGDYTVLLNDREHTFSQEARYRAGNGLFDIAVDPQTSAQTVLSEQQTVGIAAADFTGSGLNDLVVVNAGDHSFTLLPNQGQGVFATPQAGNTYFTSAQPSQVLSLTLPGDTLPSVAILMEDVSQIWIYRNNGDNTFAPPTKIDAGNDPTGFSVVTIKGQLALLVGNAYGDILTLLDDSQGVFAPDQANLQNMPLAVGTLPSGQQYAVVADQGLDQVAVYFRKPGSDQFDSPIPINSQTQPLLGPGAVQLVNVPGVANSYLVVANSLSNNVLVYPSLGNGQFGSPTPYPVGFNPISITVSDLNGDQAPDLLVANQGSNDVSVLIGAVNPDPNTADLTGPFAELWTLRPYERLNSGGSGPIAVAVRDTGGPNGPDLLVTNSDGKVALMPGIGSGGTGSGFFQDTTPQTFALPTPIVQSSLDPTTGQFFVLGTDGKLSVLGSDGFTSLLGGVSAMDAFGPDLVAGFTDGSVGLLSPGGAVLDSLSGLTDEPDALQALQNGNGVDVFLTERGQDVPVIVSLALIPVVTELPPSAPEAVATGPAGPELFVVATLVPGGLVEFVPAENPEAVPSEATFALFDVGAAAAPVVAAVLPPVGAQQIPGERAGELLLVLGDAAPEQAPEQLPVRPQAVGWDADPLGAAEALRERQQRQRAQDRLEELWDGFQDLMDQLQRWLAPPAALPGTPAAQRPSQTDPLASAIVKIHAERPAADLSADHLSSALPAERDAEGFAWGEWMPATTAPQFLPGGRDREPALSVGEVGHDDARLWHGLHSAPTPLSGCLASAVLALSILPRKENRGRKAKSAMRK